MRKYLRLHRIFIAQDMKKGTTAVFIIFFILTNKSVLVSVLTRIALVDIGEHLSPKYEPARTAPPVRRVFISIACPIVAHITPIVAAVPNAVPVSTETKQHRINAATRNTDGVISLDA